MLSIRGAILTEDDIWRKNTEFPVGIFCFGTGTTFPRHPISTLGALQPEIVPESFLFDKESLASPTGTASIQP